MVIEHPLQLCKYPEQRVPSRCLGRLAVARAAGLHECVRTAPEIRERLPVATQVEDVSLDADALVGQRAQQPRPLGAAVARVPQRPERADVRVQVSGAKGPLHLGARVRHLGERRLGALLGPAACQERFEPEPQRLDLL